MMASYIYISSLGLHRRSSVFLVMGRTWNIFGFEFGFFIEVQSRIEVWLKFQRVVRTLVLERIHTIFGRSFMSSCLVLWVFLEVRK